MSWFAVDDGFHVHVKTEQAGFASIGLWTVAGSMCRQRRSEGFVTAEWVRRQPQGTTLAKRLVAAGLWREEVTPDGKGYRFHDWERWQLAESELEVRRARDRDRQRRKRAQGGVTNDVD